MSLDGVNRQLALVWADWSRQWAADLPRAVAAWSEKPDQPGSLRLLNSKAELSLDAPPAYASLSTKRLSLSAPGSELPPCQIHIAGDLDGSLATIRVAGANLGLFRVDYKPLDILISNFRLAVDAVLDDSDSTRPPMIHEPITLTGGLDIKVTGAIQLTGTLAVLPPGPGTLPGLSLSIPDADFSGLLDVPGARAQVDLTLALSPTPHIDIHAGFNLAGVPVRTSTSIPLTLPGNVTDLVGVLAQAELPRVWPTTPHPTTVSAPAPDPDPDPAEVARLYRDNAAEIEDGLEAHLPFIGASPALRRFSAILDNQYPPRVLGHITPPPDPAHPPVPLQTRSAGDCAIWTGHALAAEAFRYADGARRSDTAQMGEASRRAADILTYITLLFEIPRLATEAVGDPQTGLLCRCVLPQSLAVQNDDFKLVGQPQEYYQGVVIPGDADNPWVGKARDTDGPTRDALTGIALGLTLAHQLIQDPDIQAAASRMLTDLLTYLLDHAWDYPTPAGLKLTLGPDGRLVTRTVTSFFHEFLHQLAFLRAGASVNPTAFAAPYDALATDLSDAAWLPAWGDVLEPIDKYYKFNLDHGCLLLLLLLEKDSGRRANYMQALEILRQALGHHRNAYFQLIGVLADPAYGVAECSGTVDVAGHPLTVASEIRTLLDEWIERRDDAQGPNRLPLYTIPPTAEQELLIRYSTAPATFQDYRDFYVLGDEGLLSLQALPIRQRTAGSLDFAWQRDPFHSGLAVSSGVPAVDAGLPDVEAPGVDYLLACWMAAYLGIV